MAEKVAVANDIKLLEKLPLDPSLAEKVDQGQIEQYDGKQMDAILDVLKDLGVDE